MPQPLRHHLLLALILTGHVALFLWGGPYVSGSDDLAYASLAQAIREGNFTFTDHHFSHRVGLLAPTAALYGLFGVNAFTTTALALLSSLLAIAWVHRVAGRCAGPLAAHLAALLLATNTFQVQQISYLGPDIIISVCAFAALAILQEARLRPTPDRALPTALGAAVFFIFGFLAKCTMTWIVLFAIGLMAWDVARGRHLRLWGWLSLAGLLFALAYLGLYQFLRQDPLYRFHVVEAVVNNPAGYWVFTPESGNSLLKRLTYQPLLLILATSGYVTLLFLGLPTLLQSTLRKALPQGGELLLWGNMAMFGILTFWFATSSFKFYNPIGLYDRHMLFILPPLAVLGGTLLAQMIRTDLHRQAAWMAVAGLGLMIPLHLLGYWKRELMLLEIPLLLVATRPWWSRGLAGRHAGAIVTGTVVVTLLAMPIPPILKGHIGPLPLFTVQQQLANHLQGLDPRPTRLYANRRQIQFIRYFFQFRPPAQLTLVDWQTTAAPPSPTARTLAVLGSRMGRPDLQPYLSSPPPDWKLLWHTSMGGEILSLYETGHAGKLIAGGK